jgi:brefeldin A-resistance guanine nucleotide exchange factor 1
LLNLKQQKPPVDPSSLAQAKASKRTLLEGIIRFNEKPKDGIAFLDSKGLIYTPETHDLPRHEVLARFLKTCPRLDKKLLGDYISRPDNVKVLRSFIEQFNFKGVSHWLWLLREAHLI